MGIIWILAALLLVCLTASYICYRMAFLAVRKKPLDAEGMDLPEGKVYEPFHDAMRNWIREARALPQEDVAITSFDGLTLRGKYYEYAPGAPVELMMHGYRGSSERDMSGGVQRCFAAGRSALVVDQRCAGRSEGKAITFGIREHRDCLDWVEFMIRKFGPDVKIILTGISMGASTVLMAGGKPLPPNVIGILADCGFTSAKEIIQEVIRQMGLPPKFCYPFVRLGAKLFGKFDLEETSAVEAMRKCTVPVIFYHGQEDDFVPMEMSKANFEACASRKALVIIPGAGHGLSYAVDPETYLRTLREFFGPEASAIKTE